MDIKPAEPDRLERTVERTIHRYALGASNYEHDLGMWAYLCASPIEVPYRMIQSVRNTYYHIFRIEHRHD